MEAIGGLHHVTAITGDARGNLDFYRRLLGMRLVKKTVNQDDVSAYHLFYADAAGTPGTDLTFFDWPGTPPNREGGGTLGPIALRVESERALDWWSAELSGQGLAVAELTEPGGRAAIAFSDPEGQRLELVADGGVAGGRPWAGSRVPPEFQIKGLCAITVTSLRPQVTRLVLEKVLGFRPASEEAGVTVFEAGAGGPGSQVRLLTEVAEPGRPGRGGVHHVAFRVADLRAQEEWRSAVEASGLQVTPLIDRFYFSSIYFREPGGALFEIATDGPGFAADEPEATLGESLALPPFLEPQRERIEANLVPL